MKSPTEWMEQTVVLTLEKVGETGKVIKCTTESSQFNCVAESVNPTGINSFVPTVNEVTMTATLNDQLEATSSYRCTVTVGDGADDEKAVDTKLIYAQKISKFTWITHWPIAILVESYNTYELDFT